MSAPHQTEDAPGLVPALPPSAAATRVYVSPGASLSAMERAVGPYRKGLTGMQGGATTSAARVDGYRDGWQAAVEYLRSIGAVR